MNGLQLPCLASCLPYYPTKGCAQPAIVKHFLPLGWSPEYKFTVFEDAFLVIFIEVDSNGVQIREDDGFHLARPVLETRAATLAASGVYGASFARLPAFELVWPLKMDNAFTRQVTHAFSELAVRQRPCKRKDSGRASELALEVGYKLRKLSMD